MPEPLTLAAVGGVVLTEGIKFLYGQAAEAVKKWRETKAASKPVTAPATAITPPPTIFDGQLAPLEFHLDKVEPLQEHLLALRRALVDYADGLETVNSGDDQLLQAVDALRQAMEVVYQQRLTLKGERRPASGPLVEGTIDVKTVVGTAIAVEARLIASGRVVARATADRVEAGGTLVGLKAGTIG